MNHYQAREIANEFGKPSGRYHYTVRHDADIMPVGYCAEGCPGHSTAQEAYQHQTQYELDQWDPAHDGTFHGAQYPCKVCEAWTQHFAVVGDQHYAICDAHRTREHLASLHRMGQSWSS